MKCHKCKTEMVCEKTVYHYRESGLEDVFLDGIDAHRCPNCDEEIISIPNVPELHNLIASILIEKDSPLTDVEIRFLRKNAGLSAIALSKYMGVDNATISRWENGKQEVIPSNDRLIRLICSIYSGKNEKHTLEGFKNIRKERTAFKLNIPPEDWKSPQLSC